MLTRLQNWLQDPQEQDQLCIKVLWNSLRSWTWGKGDGVWDWAETLKNVCPDLKTEHRIKPVRNQTNTHLRLKCSWKTSVLLFSLKAFDSRKVNSSSAGIFQSRCRYMNQGSLILSLIHLKLKPQLSGWNSVFPSVLVFPIPSLHLTQKVTS